MPLWSRYQDTQTIGGEENNTQAEEDNYDLEFPLPQADHEKKPGLFLFVYSMIEALLWSKNDAG